MKSIKLSDLLDRSLPPYDVLITGLSLDSRKVQPGDLFFAFQGTSQDGRQFIDEAIKKGAHAVLAETDQVLQLPVVRHNVPIISFRDLKHYVSEIAGRFYQNAAESMTLIGVTGTNGKTSCTYFLASILKQLAQPCGVIGTLGYGIYDDIQTSGMTTPDAITIQRILAEFKEQKTQYVAMEVSSHSLSQARVEALPFTVGIFTNLTQDHLDYHGTMEAYGAAKKRLFENLKTKYAVINADDPFSQTLMEAFPNKKNLLTYSTHASASVYATQVKLDHGIRAHIVTPWGEGELQTSLMGQFNLSNVLAVITALGILKIPLETILTCFKKVKSVPGRMETVGGHEQPLVVVDYSHTPDSLEKALQALRPHCQGKLFCVFGCGGDRDRGKRPLMAAIAERCADHVIVTDDNPRTEDPEQIVADILKGFVHPEKIIVQHDRSKAIYNSIQYAQRGDCVLIAGKGAETYQQIGEVKIPFSDIEQVNRCLAENKKVREK